MELFFASLVGILSIVLVVRRWRRIGPGDLVMWFLLSNMAFVFAGFYINAIETAGGQGGWAYDALMVVSVGTLSIILGSSLGTVGGSRPISADYLGSQQVLPPRRIASRRLFIAAIVVLIPAWSYFVLLGYVPLFHGVGAVLDEGISGLGELQASRLSRDGYLTAQGQHIPMQGLMELARNLGAPILASYAAVQLRLYGRSVFRIGVVLVASTTVLLAGQRWPLIYLGVALVAGSALAGVKFPPRRVLSFGVFVGLMGLVTSLMQRRTSEVFTDWGDAARFAVENIFGRVVFEQSLIPILSYQNGTFPPGSLLGRSYLDSLASYLPGPGVSFPVEFYMATTGSRLAWTAAPDFYTEAYINFGLGGVVILSTVWGWFLARFPRVRLSVDPSLSKGVHGGMVAVLAASCFTGPVFTLGGFILAVGVLVSARILAPWRPPTISNQGVGRTPRMSTGPAIVPGRASGRG